MKKPKKEYKNILSKIDSLLRIDFVFMFLFFLLFIFIFLLYLNISKNEKEDTVLKPSQVTSKVVSKEESMAIANDYLSIELKKVTPSGSPPRVEREYTFDFVDSDLGDMKAGDLADEILVALKDSIDKDIWQVPKIVGENFYADEKAKEFFYRDIYFDTPDNLNYKHNTLYRLRNRFKNSNLYKAFLKDRTDEKYWPYRIEFQAKTDFREEDDGFSAVKEARFEFREESAPFSKDNPPPERPWDLKEFIGYLQSGKFKNYYTWPAKSLVEYLMPAFTDEDRLYYEPRLFLLTERRRSHFNIMTKWGSGPNPEQSYIITLDISKIYPASYLDYLDGKAKKPKLAGEMIEIETEFERNVSRELDKAMLKALEAGNSNELAYLNSAREAFFHDQKVIMNTIIKYFAEKNISIVPNKKSKYKKAFEML